MGNKKAASGITSLIIFIAVILISLIFVGLYLSMTNKLETESHDKVSKSKSEISKAFFLVDLKSTYEGESLQDFVATLKNNAVSDMITLETITLNIVTSGYSSDLAYNGESTSHGPGGYFTLGVETYEIGDLDDDINMDGQIDRLEILANGDVLLNLSGSDPDVRLGNCSSDTTFQSYTFDSDYVESVSGNCEASSVTSVTITPTRQGEGYFTVDFIKEADNHLEGELQGKEVVNIHFETQQPIGPDKKIHLYFLPDQGNALEHIVFTPDTPKVGQVHLTHY